MRTGQINSLHEHRTALGQAFAQLHRLEYLIAEIHEKDFLNYAIEHITDLKAEIRLRQRAIARHRWISMNLAIVYKWFARKRAQ